MTVGSRRRPTRADLLPGFGPEPFGVNMSAEDVAAYRAARKRAVAAGWRMTHGLLGVEWSRNGVLLYERDLAVLAIERLGRSGCDSVTVTSMRQAVAVLDALELLGESS